MRFVRAARAAGRRGGRSDGPSGGRRDPTLARRLLRGGAMALAGLLLGAAPLAAQAPAARPESPPGREALPGLLREVLRADPAILGEVLRANPDILGEVLRENPRILRDAFEALREAELRDRDGAARAAILRHAGALFGDAADPLRGRAEAPIAIVEFFDVRCPYCKQLHLAMAELVRRNPDVRVVLKDLPVLGPNSLLAARALLAAQRQGKYEALHAALMRLREDPAEAVLRREAERAGLDWARLRREMDDPAIARRLEANRTLAEQLRIEGTPALVVGESLVAGAVDLAALERMVAELRERARRGG